MAKKNRNEIETMTLIEDIYDKFNTMSDAEFKSWMLNTDLIELENKMIIKAFKIGYKECEIDHGLIPESYPNYGTKRFSQIQTKLNNKIKNNE